MSFNQEKLDKTINQTRGIFDTFIYKTDDTLADTQVAGYFSASRFVGESGWNGGKLEIKAADGYTQGFIDAATGSFTPSSASAYGGCYNGTAGEVGTNTNTSSNANFNYALVVARSLGSGIEVVAGGGLKNISGAAGIFEYDMRIGGYYYGNSQWHDFGAVKLLVDEVTYSSLYVGIRGFVPPQIQGQTNVRGFIDLAPNETAFIAARNLSGSGAIVYTGLSFDIKRIA